MARLWSGTIAIGTPALPDWRGAGLAARRSLAVLGPGALVAVGYMDPGNWATDLAGGSAYGYELLSVVLLSSAMAVLLQVLSARLGIVSGRDLATCCRERYPRPAAVSLWLLAEIGIVACDLAELIGVAIALGLLLHMPLMLGLLLAACDAILVLHLQDRGIGRLEATVVGLMALVAACLGIETVLTEPHLAGIAAGLVPGRKIIADSGVLYLAIGIVGATVMPHNLYLHSWLVRRQPPGNERAAIRRETRSTVGVLSFAFLVNAAILIVASAVFHASGRTDIADLGAVHALLTPLIGVAGASSLFAIALLAAGLNATYTGTLAGQVVMEGFVQIRLKPWIRRLVTRLMAVIPALVAVEIAGDAGIDRLLVLSQVVLSLQLPFAVLPLLKFVGSRAVMGIHVAPRTQRIAGWLIAILLVALDGKLAFDTIFGS